MTDLQRRIAEEYALDRHLEPGHCSICGAPCDEYASDGECVHDDCDDASGAGCGAWNEADDPSHEYTSMMDGMPVADVEPRAVPDDEEISF